MKKRLKIRKFKNEAEEQNYWAKFDLSKRLTPSDFVSVVFPRLKPRKGI